MMVVFWPGPRFVVVSGRRVIAGWGVVVSEVRWRGCRWQVVLGGPVRTQIVVVRSTPTAATATTGI